MALFLRLQYSRKITKFCFLDYNLKKKYIYIYIYMDNALSYQPKSRFGG